MASVEEYRSRVARVMESQWRGDNIRYELSVGSLAEAKQALTGIRQKQRELRQIKKELQMFRTQFSPLQRKGDRA